MYLEYDVDDDSFELVIDGFTAATFSMDELKHLREMITTLLGDES